MDSSNTVTEPLLKESGKRKESGTPSEPFIKEEQQVAKPASAMDPFWRYAALPVGMMLCLMSGTLYGWSVISKAVGHSLQFTDTQLVTIFSIATIGQYIGFIAGWLVDKFGPALCVFYGFVLASMGYLLMWSQIRFKYSHSEYLFGFYYAIVGQGSVSMYMGSLVTSSRNYNPKLRGLVVGLLASTFGLSSAVWEQIWNYLIPGSEEVLLERYLLSLVVCIVIVGIIGCFLLKLRDYPSAVTVQTDDHDIEVSQELHVISDDSEIVKDVSGLQVFVNLDFYLIMLGFMLACGSSLMFIGNMKVISTAMSFNLAKNGVTVQSLCNCAGRLVFGAVSDLSKSLTSRVFWCMVAGVMLAVAHLGYSFVQELWSMWAIVVVNGFCYGGLFALTPIFLSEHFGTKGFGMTWGVGTIFLAIGNFGIGAIASAFFKHYKKEGEKDCHGRECSEWTLRITGALVLVAVAMYCVLAIRTRRRYKPKLI